MILALDSSSSLASVAWRCSGGETSVVGVNSAQSYDESLSPGVASVLAKSGEVPKQILIGAGPGSFTGLRIGFALAKGLAAAFQAPIASVDSFHAAAEAAANDGVSAAVLLVVADAGRGELFLASYRLDGCVARVIRPPQIVAREMAIREAQDSDAAESAVIALDSASATGFPGALPVPAVGLGLLALWARFPEAFVVSRDSAQISALQPRYLREVHARTVAERQSDGKAKA